MEPQRATLLRQLPQVDELLRHPTLLPAVTPLPRALAAAAGAPRPGGRKREWLTTAPAADLPPELDLEGSAPGTPGRPWKPPGSPPFAGCSTPPGW